MSCSALQHRRRWRPSAPPPTTSSACARRWSGCRSRRPTRTAYPEADVEFHLALAEAAGNRFLRHGGRATCARSCARDIELAAAAGIQPLRQPPVQRRRARRARRRDRGGRAGRSRGASCFDIMSRHHEFVIGLYAFGTAVPGEEQARECGAGAAPMEVAPGIHRIESVLGPRPFSQYLLRDERSLLVDTGVKETPAEVILPFLDGLQPDFVLNSHADVDHFGGNAAIKEAAPEALFLAHELDVPWIESADAIMRERYGWYAEHGLAYEPDVFAWLARRDRARTRRSTSTCAAARGSASGPSLDGRGAPPPGPHAGPRRPLGSRVPHRDRDGRRDGPRPARHGGQRDPPAAVLRRRRATSAPRGRSRRSRPRAAPDRALRRDGGRGGRPLPRRHGRVRRGRGAARRGGARGVGRADACPSSLALGDPRARPVHVDGERARQGRSGRTCARSCAGPRARRMRPACAGQPHNEKGGM